MIVSEDASFEKRVFEDGSPIAVPVQLTRTADGELTALVYSFAEEIARAWEARFAADPMGEESLGWLAGRLIPLMAERGYDEFDFGNYPLYDYRPASLRREKILDGCELIATLDGERWEDVPLDEFDPDPKNPLDRIAVMRDPDGVIVCFAALNDVSAEEGLAELNVECAGAWRGRGYGSSCVALLTDYLDELGTGAQYIVPHDNLPSIRLAESVGFARHAEIFPFVFRRTGEDDEAFFNEL